MWMVKVRILPPQPILSVFLRGKAGVQPALPPAIHRFDVGVTHLLEIVRGERGTEAAAAVKNELGGGIGHALLDVAFDDAFGEMNRTGQMASSPLAFFAHVNQYKFFTGVEPPL